MRDSDNKYTRMAVAPLSAQCKNHSLDPLQVLQKITLQNRLQAMQALRRKLRDLERTAVTQDLSLRTEFC